MKRRFLLLGCLVLVSALFAVPILAMAEDGAASGDDGKDNPWGDAAIDHKLNAGWEYPADYIARPLVYSKRVTEFGANFQYKYAHHYWNDDGELIAGSFKSKTETLNLLFGMGLTDNLSVSINWPLSYKKTQIYEGNQNYRSGRKNTYGALAEEAAVDFVDHSDPWKIWEADLPSLGDVQVHLAYQFFRRLDPTTSLAVESNIKWPTGNDNPRRGAKIRNDMTSGQTNWYNGLGFKQSAWKFGFELHAGYLWRMPANTKYAPGEVDLGDQVLGDAEIAFQLPKLSPIHSSFALACAAHYLYQIAESTIIDNLDKEVKLEDFPRSALAVEPKLVYQWDPDLDVYFNMNIPMMGQNSFLVYSRSYYTPPFDIEGNDGVGVTYTLGLKKRWQ